MFRRLKKKIGSVLVLLGIVSLLSLTGADDIAIAEGVHNPILPVIIKGILFIFMILAGAVMVRGENNANRY